MLPMKFLIFLLTDIVLGYLPQAAGCAICLFIVTKQNLRSRKFLFTTCIYAAVAILIRLAYNIKLIDFGFHTIIIWIIFILVAIWYNKSPVLQSTCSILLSGVLITASELVTAGVLIAIFGNENFNAMMNNTQTLDGQIVKAVCGIPTNLLFLVIVLVIYFVAKARRAKKALVASQAAVENT